MARYSGTPLWKKLGVKRGIILVALGAPSEYRTLLEPVPFDFTLSHGVSSGAAFVHAFVTRRAELKRVLSNLRSNIADDATVWISWPKKSSGLTSDVTEDVVRAEALPLGLVDVKVCAVNETWSGLKLVIRRQLRASK